MIVVTGATGQLGRLVIEQLLTKVAPSEIVAAVRSPEKAADLAAKGITVRQADYTQPETLNTAFAGADKVLLISSSTVGQRVAQHRAVIAAAAKAGVKLIAYTSILNAPNSPLGLAAEHKETENMLKLSGIDHVLLRNGWYSENYAGAAPKALQHGVVMGAAGEGRIASAARADYAAAAATVMTLESQAGKVYELAGDTSYSLSELAAEIGKQLGKEIKYVNLSQVEYKDALLGFGLPVGLAALLADSDVGASKGGLFDDSHDLSRLIGRPTTPIAQTIAKVLKA
jgi:NAD(P)H dehydrogenase (quinone)